MTFPETTGVDLDLRAAEIRRALRKKGKTIRSTIDCPIVTLGDAHGCFVLARDRDLEAILASGLVKSRLWRLASPST